MTRRLLAVAVIAAACGHAGPVGRARFAVQPPVWKVNDRRDVPAAPVERAYARLLYFFDQLVYQRAVRAMELPAPRRAINVNAWDEVPDSTWFTNRIGVRDLTVDEIRRGPNEHAGPDVSQPWQVTGSKVGGRSIGIVIKDARGDRYIVKFDEPHVPVMETATDVVVQRLLWACGYNVPENDIVYVRRDQLVLADGAKVKDVFGNARPMTVADLDGALAKVYRNPDGTYRTLTSRFLAGVPIGGFPMAGVREDDPNDVIPHEHRRELRGLKIIFGWLQQTDVKEDNTLDMFVEGSDGRHYVRHYLVDFGKSLGVNALLDRRPSDGHANLVDPEHLTKGTLSLGLWRRPFEGIPEIGIQGIGLFDAAHYHPGQWRPHAPYEPFELADAYDVFWAAKVIMRLSRAHIRAAVEQGKYEDPRAVEYLVETLVERQRRAGHYAFTRVNPLDRFAVEGARVCFDDLLILYGLEPGAAASTTYTAVAYDYDGRALGWQRTAHPDAAGRACLDDVPTSSSPAGYTIVTIATARASRRHAPVELHLAGGMLVGIERR